MIFAAICGPLSGRATPSLRETPATAQDEPNRQRIHLAEPKRCLDEAGHLSAQFDVSFYLISFASGMPRLPDV